ncbi:MAG: 1-acyl-sn-glycerol-3-phosphate acyltransferase, partial [Thermoanaerobaculia bacterium]|nr:1-acyl-sn-glycerol-3-phosphate acyltransferase [Thermoanaerobaculia bacterium]
SNCEPDPSDAATVLHCCREASVAHCIVVASAAVHEPNPHHPGPVGEGAAPSQRRSNPIAKNWRELEATVERVGSNCGSTRITLLRATAMLPPPWGPRGYPQPGLGRLFVGRFPWVPLGFDPPLQLLPLSALAAALRDLASGRAATSKTVHLAPEGARRLRPLLRSLGRRGIPLPGGLLALAQRWTSARGQLDYRRYPSTLDGTEWRRSQVPDSASPSPDPADEENTPVVRNAGSRPAVPSHDDPYGFDKPYIDLLGRTLFRFLHDLYWRVEIAGIDHVPERGGAVLVGIHRGFQPWDGVMALHGMATRRSRYPRFLIHPSLTKFPFLAPYMTKLGGLLANQENADWVLQGGHLLGVYPEGIRGAFTLYREAYRIRRLGRGEFVTMAIRNGVPIVPFVTVGSAEIFPLWARFRWPAFSRYTLWPYFPVTTPLPLPSKWHTEFLEPIPVQDQYPAEAATDARVIAEVHDLVRSRMRASMQRMLERRPGIFLGKALSESGPASTGPT